MVQPGGRPPGGNGGALETGSAGGRPAGSGSPLGGAPVGTFPSGSGGNPIGAGALCAKAAAISASDTEPEVWSSD